MEATLLWQCNEAKILCMDIVYVLEAYEVQRCLETRTYAVIMCRHQLCPRGGSSQHRVIVQNVFTIVISYADICTR